MNNFENINNVSSEVERLQRKKIEAAKKFSEELEMAVKLLGPGENISLVREGALLQEIEITEDYRPNHIAIHMYPSGNEVAISQLVGGNNLAFRDRYTDYVVFDGEKWEGNNDRDERIEQEDLQRKKYDEAKEIHDSLYKPESIGETIERHLTHSKKRKQ